MKKWLNSTGHSKQDVLTTTGYPPSNSISASVHGLGFRNVGFWSWSRGGLNIHEP